MLTNKKATSVEEVALLSCQFWLATNGHGARDIRHDHHPGCRNSYRQLGGCCGLADVPGSNHRSRRDDLHVA
jgi:hypothetical protein